MRRSGLRDRHDASGVNDRRARFARRFKRSISASSARRDRSTARRGAGRDCSRRSTLRLIRSTSPP